jgi:hypothetical protein
VVPTGGEKPRPGRVRTRPKTRAAPAGARRPTAPVGIPPDPQSQSFSRSYGSNLPTSLTYVLPLTRGCSPWRPDAVMGTTERASTSELGVSRAVVGAPDGAEAAPLCRAGGSISERLDSGATKLVNEKRKLSPGPTPTGPSPFASPPNFPSRRRNLNLLPFRRHPEGVEPLSRAP